MILINDGNVPLAFLGKGFNKRMCLKRTAGCVRLSTVEAI
jgi:hypothetical protein